MTAGQAVALLNPKDTLGIPLASGVPARTPGKRDDWTDLRVRRAARGRHELFSRPGVHYPSAFFGPLERAVGVRLNRRTTAAQRDADGRSPVA